MSTNGMLGKTSVNPGFVSVPTLEFPLPAWQKMMAFILACPTEINGFGYLDQVGNGFRMDDVFILEQTATPVGVEVSPEVLARHLYELVRDGGEAGRMRFQWHSHVDMAAYFSGTDLDNIEGYTGDWMISLVGNKRGEYELRLDVFRPFRVWTPLELKIIAPLDQTMIQQCSREIHDKVRQTGVFRRSRVKPVPAEETTLSGLSLINGDVR